VEDLLRGRGGLTNGGGGEKSRKGSLIVRLESEYLPGERAGTNQVFQAKQKSQGKKKLGPFLLSEAGNHEINKFREREQVELRGHKK